MLGRREKRLQTVINTIGCARRSSLTSLPHWMSANWMWRLLWKAPSVVSSSQRRAGLMAAESPGLTARRPPKLKKKNTPRNHNKLSHLPENKQQTNTHACAGNLQSCKKRFKRLSQQKSQVSLFMEINFCDNPSNSPRITTAGTEKDKNAMQNISRYL